MAGGARLHPYFSDALAVAAAADGARRGAPPAQADHAGWRGCEDDTVLGALRARFPTARITHIYASTEAGTGFAVRDGEAGFPAAWLEEHAHVDGARLSVRDGMLWLRPPGGEQGDAPHIVRDAAGYIRTGDRVAMKAGGRGSSAGRIRRSMSAASRCRSRQ